MKRYFPNMPLFNVIDKMPNKKTKNNMRESIGEEAAAIYSSKLIKNGRCTSTDNRDICKVNPRRIYFLNHVFNQP